MDAKRQSLFILIILMCVVVLGTAGIALPYPVLAPYFLSEDINGLNSFLSLPAAILLGISLAAFPLGALLGSPFVGVLADRFGNKRVMLHSLWLSMLGYLITALALYIEWFVLFIVARLLTGMCQGNISIARAMAGELHPIIERSKTQSLIFSAVYSGWLIGPALGGYLMVFGATSVFLVAAGLVLLCFLTSFYFLPSNSSQLNVETTIWQELKHNNSLSLIKLKAFQPIACFYFLYAMGLNGFYEYYPAWMVEFLSFSSTEIANVSVVLTATMIFSSAFFYPRIQARFGTHGLIVFGSLLVGSCFMLLPSVGAETIYLTFGLIGLLIAISNGSVPTYLAENFSSLGLARVMGLHTLIFYGTNTLIACIGGLVAVFDVRFVLIGSGFLIIVAAMLYQVMNRKIDQNMPNLAH